MIDALPLSRREALRRVAALSLALSALDVTILAAPSPKIIGGDPNLLLKEIPWPRVLTELEKRTVTAFADLIIPSDEHGPAASAVGVPDFIDEWVSAPYEQQKKDLEVIRKGLAWLDAEAQQRFRKDFAALSPAEQAAIADDLLTDGTPAHRAAFKFFGLFRDRVAGGYYTTREGWGAIGYVGNVPLPEYPGPPREALVKLGLAE